MPRTTRAAAGDLCYHVINRGNARATVFHKDGDYQAFLDLIAAANDRLPMRVLGFCLMPNHFHLILRPHEDGDLSRWMQWLTTTHVRRYHKHHQTVGGGHIWQGRFKAFPIQRDEHLLAVLRYIERNPKRANLVDAAQDWRWSSLRWRTSTAPLPWLAKLPIELPANWTRRVNQPESEKELEAVRHSIRRSSPFGGEKWTAKVAAQLGLESTLRPRGRPRKTAE